MNDYYSRIIKIFVGVQHEQDKGLDYRLQKSKMNARLMT